MLPRVAIAKGINLSNNFFETVFASLHGHVAVLNRSQSAHCAQSHLD